MDTKQAIKLLHNNQYQKHLGNGEYDYIHPLTDSEAKSIESLIERQERMIGLAIEELCVLDCNKCIAESVCDKERPCGESWRRWLEQEAQHD